MPLKLLDKQRFLGVLFGKILERFEKKVPWNIEVVVVDHARSRPTTILRLLNGSEEIMKLPPKKLSQNCD